MSRIAQMMMIMAGLGVSLAVSPTVVEAQSIDWRDTVDGAFSDARESGLPVLLLVTGGVWCDPCNWLEDNTLQERSVTSLIDAGFVPVRLLDTQPGWEDFRIERLPTIVVMDTDGVELDRIAGAVTGDVLRGALAPYAASVEGSRDDERSATTGDEAGSRRDSLRGAVFRIDSVGTLWNDGAANWYSQDAGLPPRLEEYDRDEVFLYLRDRASATLIAVPVERPEAGARAVLWRWDPNEQDWRELTELQRLY